MYVLWARVVPFTSNAAALNWTAEVYISSQSPSKTGPFTDVNPAVNVSLNPGGDFSLLIDQDQEAYIIYTSHVTKVRMVVERLTSDYLYSTGQASNVFGPSPVEAPALIRSHDHYYAIFGHTCCYCLAGSNALVYTADSPLGPYTYQQEIGESSTGQPTTKSQLNYVAKLNSRLPNDSECTTQWLWTGTRWGTSPDGSMRHDYQYWAPIISSSNDSSGVWFQNMTYQDSIVVDLC